MVPNTHLFVSANRRGFIVSQNNLELDLCLKETSAGHSAAQAFLAFINYVL